MWAQAQTSIENWIAAAGLPVWTPLAAAVVAALLLALLARSRAGRGLASLLLLAVIGAAALVYFPTLGDRLSGFGRGGSSALEARAAALSREAMIARPALACLDQLGGEAVDAACERALYAQPDTLSLALWVIQERLALLTEASTARAQAPALEAIRRPLEADRFALVAQVLTMRDGCNATACDALKLFRDPSFVAANLKSGAYAAALARNAAGWSGDAVTAPSAAAPPPANMPGAAFLGASRGGNGLNLPSSASIPPVSIMNAEPAAPAPPAAAPAPPPQQAQKKAAARPRPAGPPPGSAPRVLRPAEPETGAQ